VTDTQRKKVRAITINIIPIVIAIIVAVVPVIYTYGSTQSRLDMAEKKIEKLETIYEKISDMCADIRELKTKFNIVFEERNAR
jgi:uncharacterized protein YoxC